MGLADDYRAELAKVMADEPATLELEVFGEDALRKMLAEHDQDGTMFLDSLAGVVPVISQWLLTSLEEIDALKAAISATNDEPETD
jgi:hypothetical protein